MKPSLSQSTPEPEDLISLLSPSQTRDLDTLHKLVTEELEEIYTKGDLVMALRDVNFDAATAFLTLRKRGEATKKRARLPDSFHDTWSRPKNPRLSLPAMSHNHRLFHSKNQPMYTPLHAARDMDARNSVVTSSAPPTYSSSETQYNLPYSQKNLSPRQEEQPDNDHGDVHESQVFQESDPTVAANILSLNLLDRQQHPVKEELSTEQQQQHPLDDVFDKLAVAWTPDVKKLLDAACAAHATATLKHVPAFDAADAANLLLDIVSLLPHVQRLDALVRVPLFGRPISPTDAEVAASDKAAMEEAMAPLVTPEAKIKALNAACTNHTRRLEAFRRANVELVEQHAATSTQLKAKLEVATALVQHSRQNVAEMAATLEKARTDEDAAATKLDDLVVARRAEFVAAGLQPKAAKIRAITAVYTNPVDVEAVTFRELHAAAERATEVATADWHGATLVDMFATAVQALVRYVVALRQETMTGAYNDVRIRVLYAFV
ncbi:hypothetical protein DYB37_001934 [Aphanomyces astaci]|uniref:Uncharacterized protein n=2 Tax=Aphanomyces astaci TaxID=112090 RepID=A0A3R7EZA1_APHAT|nr:hypothetical protein DYB37_001934 [Aphanomyces astaci]